MEEENWQEKRVWLICVSTNLSNWKKCDYIQHKYLMFLKNIITNRTINFKKIDSHFKTNYTIVFIPLVRTQTPSQIIYGYQLQRESFIIKWTCLHIHREPSKANCSPICWFVWIKIKSTTLFPSEISRKVCILECNKNIWMKVYRRKIMEFHQGYWMRID